MFHGSWLGAGPPPGWGRWWVGGGPVNDRLISLLIIDQSINGHSMVIKWPFNGHKIVNKLLLNGYS